MATISLYVSAQTELADVAEFFQKKHFGKGEHPLAFFDGVFYESHLERVGNIAFQDYLVYTDRAVYLWARGAAKDYLDRFDLASVEVSSRNKDNDFATMNLKVRREGKDPVYVIFDMVETREAELIDRMHASMESLIERHLGHGYHQPIPDELAPQLLEAGRSVCPPRSFSIPVEEEPSTRIDSSIGYGQDLLEQYKASLGAGRSPAGPGAEAGQAGSAGGGMPPGLGGLENMLPTDPASLKRIAASIKGMVGEAPFKLRDQVMKDLQHVPGDVATVLTAVNELVSNIAGNPHAEKFVMTAIQTAVRNDGVLGSLGKVLKLTSGFGGAPKKARSGASETSRGRGDDADAFEDGTIRRKKISILDDDAAALPAEGLPVPEREPSIEAGRKKIRVQMDGAEVSSLVKDMMDMDTAPADQRQAPAVKQVESDGPSQRKKIRIVEEQAPLADATAMGQDDKAGRDDQPGAGALPEDDGRKKRKIAITTAPEIPDAMSDALLAEALGEDEPRKKGEGAVYSVLESDQPGCLLPPLAENGKAQQDGSKTAPPASGNAGSEKGT